MKIIVVVVSQNFITPALPVTVGFELCHTTAWHLTALDTF